MVKRRINNDNDANDHANNKNKNNTILIISAGVSIMLVRRIIMMKVTNDVTKFD